jgi:hypothetical protein
MSENNSATGAKTNTYDRFIVSLRNLYLSVRSSRILFLTCFLLVSGVLVLYGLQKANKFTASFTVSYDDLVRKIYGDRLYKLNKLVRNKEYGKVATYLNVDRKTAEQLTQIKGKNILGEDLTEDMNTDRIPFMINFIVKDSSVIHNVQAGIVGFLEEGNAYSSISKSLKIKEINDEIQFIDSQLLMMDSLKKKYNAESSVAVTDEKNASLTTIYNFSYELYRTRKDLVKKKNLPGNIHVLDDAIVAEKVSFPVLIVVVGGFIGGLLLFMFITLFIRPIFRKP